MEDATIEFNLITFETLRTASYSSARISRAVLRDRILFARTNQGNLAKLQVQSGDDLMITRLTVYNPAGCIIKIASNIRIRSSFSCDLDEARESSDRRGFLVARHLARRALHRASQCRHVPSVPWLRRHHVR